MPAGIWLVKFGTLVYDYFGHVPYHVGSSLERKDWRHVDVRLILPQDLLQRCAAVGFQDLIIILDMQLQQVAIICLILNNENFL